MSIRRHILMPLTIILLCAFFAPPMLTQAQQSVDLNAVLAELGPSSNPQRLIIDLLLYGIFIMGFITMLLISDKQLMPSLLMIVVLGLTVFAKLQIFCLIPLPVPENLEGVPTLVLNIGIFVLPLFVAGTVREPGKRPPALIPAVLTGLIGGVQFFLFWALFQREGIECLI